MISGKRIASLHRARLSERWRMLFLSIIAIIARRAPPVNAKRRAGTRKNPAGNVRCRRGKDGIFGGGMSVTRTAAYLPAASA